MVGKSVLGLVLPLFLTLSIILSFQPYDDCIAETRETERYTLDNPPLPDDNGNLTLDDDDEWDIIGEGIIDGNITLFDNSTIIIDNANVTINGNVWAKDNSMIIIGSSSVRVNVPSHEPILIEKQYDDPNGFVLVEDGASLKIGDSYVHLYRHDISRQIIPNGTMIPLEVLVDFGKLYIKDSFINTSGSVSVDTNNFTVIRGIVLHMNCEIEMISSTLTSGVLFYVNAYGFIDNSTFKSIAMHKNTEGNDVIVSNSTIHYTITVDKISRISFENCVLKSPVIVRYNGSVKLRDTTMSGLNISGNGTVIMDDSEFSIEPQNPNWKNLWDNSSLTLLNSSFIEKLSLYGNSSISLINSSMNSTIIYDNASATLRGSFIANLSAKGNSTVWLQSSVIGQWILSQNTKIFNFTTLTVNTKLNLQPLQVLVRLKDSIGVIFNSSETNKHGIAEFTLIREKIWINKSTMELEISPGITHCLVGADYENMHREENIAINHDFEEVELEFEDYIDPVIDKVRYKTDPFLNTKEKVLVSARVEDDDTSLARVELRYTTDNGKTWKNVTMYNTGENIYENSIPGQDDATKVRFYIVAEDKCGNIAESDISAYTVGENMVLVNNLIIITAFILVLGMMGRIIGKVLWDKKKVKKYLQMAKK